MMKLFHQSSDLLLALAVQCHLKVHQMDVETAFLNRELKEDIYMKQPEGYIEKGREHLVCKLKKSLYRLKQSPKCWNFTLDNFLKEIGFVQATGDPCLYTASEGKMFLIAVYVDDIVLTAKDSKRMADIKQELLRKFQVRDMGALHYFLGIKIIQDENAGKVWIGQQQYTENILKKFGMVDCKATRTPVDVSTKLVKAVDNKEEVDQKLYQSAVGNLLYLSFSTRPDIAFAVNNVAKFCAKPNKQHWTAVK